MFETVGWGIYVSCYRTRDDDFHEYKHVVIKYGFVHILIVTVIVISLIV